MGLKLTIETLEQGVKYVQSYHERHNSAVPIVNFERISHLEHISHFEQVNASWGSAKLSSVL